MPGAKQDIIERLQREILPLQGYKPVKGHVTDAGLGRIKFAFPGHIFPAGAIHELIGNSKEDMAASAGFTAAIVADLMKRGAVALWVSAARTIFPPALHPFGIPPEKIIFIDCKNERQVAWTLEEALKCEGLAAVIGELREINFTMSRRLQLAVERSRVTGFILRNNPRALNTTASVARWKVTSLPGEHMYNMPGVAHPRWNVELLKIRSGKPGSWQLEYVDGKFRHIMMPVVPAVIERKKTG